MDPLSITTAIVTILGAGSTVQGGFKRILALRHAPDALIALNNEVNDLHRIVRAIDDLLRKHVEERHANQTSANQNSNCVEKLQKAQEVALDVEKYIAYDLTVIAADGKITRIDRSRWLRSGTRIQGLKARIQVIKADLFLELGMFNS